MDPRTIDDIIEHIRNACGGGGRRYRSICLEDICHGIYARLGRVLGMWEMVVTVMEDKFWEAQAVPNYNASPPCKLSRQQMHNAKLGQSSDSRYVDVGREGGRRGIAEEGNHVLFD